MAPLLQRCTAVTTAGLLNIACGAGQVSKLWLACGHNSVQYTECRLNKYLYNYIGNLTCVFV